MPLFRALAKNMAASYFGESALRFCNGSYTSVCLYSVVILCKSSTQLAYDNLGPVYMIPPRRDGTFSSRLDGILA